VTVFLGIANSRMKDFFDLWVLAQRSELDRSTLRRAITTTFERRTTALPATALIGLSDEFANRVASNWLRHHRLLPDSLMLLSHCQRTRTLRMRIDLDCVAIPEWHIEAVTSQGGPDSLGAKDQLDQMLTPMLAGPPQQFRAIDDRGSWPALRVRVPLADVIHDLSTLIPGSRRRRLVGRTQSNEVGPGAKVAPGRKSCLEQF